ncbi:hypothetical protein CVT25_003576 [Psilocybe cyanescens]|uniref:Uncharacterized protein n=1 Tax=Psilocybe cyanescens TaxID=93625 RepID=A0A409WNZ2_PSICY|nr:hypothetical protein CVT25_003576 [Psilocybe cyanescens]
MTGFARFQTPLSILVLVSREDYDEVDDDDDADVFLMNLEVEPELEGWERNAESSYARTGMAEEAGAGDWREGGKRRRKCLHRGIYEISCAQCSLEAQAYVEGYVPSPTPNKAGPRSSDSPMTKYAKYAAKIGVKRGGRVRVSVWIGL